MEGGEGGFLSDIFTTLDLMRMKPCSLSKKFGAPISLRDFLNFLGCLGGCVREDGNH